MSANYEDNIDNWLDDILENAFFPKEHMRNDILEKQKAKQSLLAKFKEIERKARANELRIVPKDMIATWFDFETYRRKRLRELKTPQDTIEQESDN